MKCIDLADKDCAKKFISKTAQISFGVDPMVDRRNLLVDSWKKENFSLLAKLVRKGVEDRGDRKEFPPNPDNEGTGQRGSFELKNGSWVLTTYLAGD